MSVSHAVHPRTPGPALLRRPVRVRVVVPPWLPLVGPLSEQAHEEAVRLVAVYASQERCVSCHRWCWPQGVTVDGYLCQGCVDARDRLAAKRAVQPGREVAA